MRIARLATGLCAALGLAACARQPVPLPAPTPDCRYGGEMTAVAAASYHHPIDTGLSAAATLDSAAAVLRRHGFTVLPREAGQPVVTEVLEHRVEGRSERTVVRVDEIQPGRVMFCAMSDPQRTRRNEIVTAVVFPTGPFLQKQLLDEITAAVRRAP